MRDSRLSQGRMILLSLLFVVSVSLLGCYSSVAVLDNPVDLEPLLKVQTPAHIDDLQQVIKRDQIKHDFTQLTQMNRKRDLSFWYQTSDPACGKTAIHVTIRALMDEAQLDQDIAGLCDERGIGFYAQFDETIDGVRTRYCIPYLYQSRTGPDSFFFVYYQWEYSSLTFRKGNLEIWVDEETECRERTAVNHVVKKIAEAIQAKLDE